MNVAAEIWHLSPAILTAPQACLSRFRSASVPVRLPTMLQPLLAMD
jgi:hypothetical protein